MNYLPQLSKEQTSQAVLFALLGPMLLILWLPHVAIAARKGEIEIRVVDQQTQQPVAVRMHLKGPQGRIVQPPGVPFWKDHFVFPGKIVLSLTPGNYTFEMERGPEYRIRTGYFIIELSRPHLCWYIVSARVCDLFALSRVRVRVDQIE